MMPFLLNMEDYILNVSGRHSNITFMIILTEGFTGYIFSFRRKIRICTEKKRSLLLVCFYNEIDTFLGIIIEHINIYIYIYIYKGESKVLQYFSNIKHNLTVLHVTVINDSGLWDVELAWYSLSTTCWICLNGLKAGLRPTWLFRFQEPEQNSYNH